MIEKHDKPVRIDPQPTIRGIIIDIGIVLNEFEHMTSDELREWIEDTRDSLLEIVEPI
jgi:hypothetical protein